MTREEAIEIIRHDVFGLTDTGHANRWADVFEKLELIKFEKKEEKKIDSPLPCITINDYVNWKDKYGIIRVEEWPEGLVVYVGGEIRYKSWENILINRRVNIGLETATGIAHMNGKVKYVEKL